MSSSRQLFRRKPIAELLAESESPYALKRALGAGDLIMLGIGAVIGAGISGDRGPDRGENPRPDHRADAERGELEGTERALEPTADLAVGDALIDGLATKELRARQRAAPAPA